MLKIFLRYTSIGVLNTLVHWVVFVVIFYLVAKNQLIANAVAFCVAVTFSFIANAHFTFNAKPTTRRYLLYVVFMGSLSALTGYLADKLAVSPIITLISFSLISLGCGFIYSHFIVFKEAV